MSGIYRFVRDFFAVLFNMIYWLWHALWSMNRGVIRGLLPGQGKAVHLVVTYFAVMLEIVGLWLVAVNLAARN